MSQIFHEIVYHLCCVVVYPIDKMCYVSTFIRTNDKILRQVSCGKKSHHTVPIIFLSLTQIINILCILCDNGEVLYIVICLVKLCKTKYTSQINEILRSKMYYKIYFRLAWKGKELRNIPYPSRGSWTTNNGGHSSLLHIALNISRASLSFFDSTGIQNLKNELATLHLK